MKEFAALLQNYGFLYCSRKIKPRALSDRMRDAENYKIFLTRYISKTLGTTAVDIRASVS